MRFLKTIKGKTRGNRLKNTNVNNDLISNIQKRWNKRISDDRRALRELWLSENIGENGIVILKKRHIFVWYFVLEKKHLF